MIVTKETAILAKERGFKNRVASYYDESGQFFKRNKNPECDLWDYNTSFKGWCSAPTQDQLCTWLREEHFIWVEITLFGDGIGTCCCIKKADPEDKEDDGSRIVRMIKVVDTNIYERFNYEQTLGKGIQEALKEI